MKLILGQTLSFTGDPFHAPIDEVTTCETRGGVLIDAGRIIATGPADPLRRAYPQAEVIDYGTALISAGFIDAHTHYPQTAIIASWGKRLIDWLNTYTFPEEMRFAD
ncbi:MAG: guanine deaminase, partial [Rhodobacterales bacterium]